MSYDVDHKTKKKKISLGIKNLLIYLILFSEISVDFIDDKTVCINSTMEKNNHKFTFDKSFNPDSSQSEIFEFVAKPILNSIIS